MKDILNWGRFEGDKMFEKVLSVVNLFALTLNL